MLTVPQAIEDFGSREFVLHDTSFGGDGPRYVFPNPFAYWVQFYYAYVSWDAQSENLIIVRLEDVIENPSEILGRIAEFLSRPRAVERVRLPEHAIEPGMDGQKLRFSMRGAGLEAGEADAIESNFPGVEPIAGNLLRSLNYDVKP